MAGVHHRSDGLASHEQAGAAPTPTEFPEPTGATSETPSSSAGAALTPATVDPLPGPSGFKLAVSAVPKRKTRAVARVSADQGRLAFGKPGEGWKIEKPPEPPAEEDAPSLGSDQGPTMDGGNSSAFSTTKKAHAKGKGKGKSALSPAGAATQLRPPVNGARKNKATGTDPEAADIQGVRGQEIFSEIVTFEDTVASNGNDNADPSSDPIAFEPVAGPSRPKPHKKVASTDKAAARTSMKPLKKGKGAARPRRKNITVLSSGSETEASGCAQNQTDGVSTAASIIITEDEVEAASDASSCARSPAISAGLSKTLHPFFAAKVAAPPRKRPKLSGSVGGSSAEFAIDVEADPVQPPPQAVPSFFASRLGSKPAKPKPAAVLQPRWPTREETLIDLYSEAPADPHRLAGLSDVRRSKMREDASVDASAFWARLMPTRSTSIPVPGGHAAVHRLCVPLDGALPDPLAEHPAFARLAASPSAHTSELWTDRFRPLAAAEVLGNEDEAVYLRDWLVALQVKGAELNANGAKGIAKRQVLRKVDKSARKRRKKATEDDWIVDDGELEYWEDPIESDNGGSSSEKDPLESLKRAPAPAPILPSSPSKRTQHYTARTRPQSSTAAEGSKTASYPPIAVSSLFNSILLVGPCGAGKTAAVYACVHELGWDVFEVYPGVRRSGVALGEMVGEVGKNHLVGRGGTGGGSAVAAYASNGRSTSANPLTSLLKKAPMDDGFGFLKDKEAQAASSVLDRPNSATGQPTGEHIRQSCILLEEVDILFQEDKGFWPAVVSLISESRRPVIMTCNDVSAVPLDDLPLQATLVFLSPPSEVATPYLQRLVRVGGLDLDLGTIAAFYREQGYHAVSAGVPHITGHPAPSQPPESTDLRRTINNLQTLRGIKAEANIVVPSIEGEMSETRWDSWEACIADWATPSERLAPAQLMSPGDSSQDLRQLQVIASHLDCISFANAHIDWRATDISDVFDPDRFAASENDPVDYNHLLKPLPDPLAVNLPEHGLSRHIARATLALSRKTFDQGAAKLAIPQPTTSTELLDWIPRRRCHLARLLDMLEPLIEPPAPLLPSPALLLDYVPFVQAMVQIDDVLEAEDKAQAALGLGRGKQGRVMRASAQAGMAALAKWTGGAGGRVAYERQLYQLQGLELKAARGTRLPLDE